MFTWKHERESNGGQCDRPFFDSAEASGRVEEHRDESGARGERGAPGVLTTIQVTVLYEFSFAFLTGDYSRGISVASTADILAAEDKFT